MGSELKGKRICVTRAQSQSERLVELLGERSAEVLELPLIEVGPIQDRTVIDEVLEQPGVYDWIVFTSGNGVKRFFKELIKSCGDIRSIAFARIACVGAATSKVVREHFLRVDLEPSDANAESLGEEMVKTGSLDSARVLVVAGNRNRDTLVTILEDQGRAIVDVAEVYETKLIDLKGSAAADEFRTRGADGILFTSASTVEAFVSQAEHLQLQPGATSPKVFSIGPTTSEALATAGIPLTGQSEAASLDSLVEVVMEKFEE